MEKKLSIRLTDNMEGFVVEKVDYSRYEPSFRRWLVSELDSQRMSFQEAMERFKLPHYFKQPFKLWQKKYSEEFHLSLSLMTIEERTKFEAQEARIKELESLLEKAQIKTVGLETIIDIAEKDYKLLIRKKFNTKQ